MTIMEMMGQSGALTLLGMGIVFSFLIIMIIVITWVGKRINALESGKDAAEPVKTGFAAVPASGSGNAEIIAAISAAVDEYRKYN
jgi:oxaloacetate decarboxylase gamma subunit